ncbi:hypothetical protein TRSA_20050 [Treponema saccharophilum]|uniref:Uncharacterized protein n=1 Tax=Treponema saccharophilum DSM 2985 TaxID=907348 RepID=H7EIT4_9SPIR|nr:hypothetical protein TresaDRAFT_2390 [Treponema saccharophilum DSM 2985]BDC96906.1 hypothetical protein TRSA_20050 [Treponema saccharophilum]
MPRTQDGKPLGVRGVFFGKTGNYQNSIDDMSATSFS